jgi:hypothetical protein
MIFTRKAKFPTRKLNQNPIIGYNTFSDGGFANECCAGSRGSASACCAFLYYLHQPVSRIGGNVIKKTTLLRSQFAKP